MNFNPDYASTTITNNIQIHAQPIYRENGGVISYDEFGDMYSSTPSLFDYYITIRNLSDRPVKLQARAWVIQTKTTIIDKIAGDGVVGYNPVLEPGQSFSYSSSCSLYQHTMGMMFGEYYFMYLDTYEFFTAKIDPFILISGVYDGSDKSLDIKYLRQNLKDFFGDILDNVDSDDDNDENQD